MTLRAELAYTNATGTILCFEDIPAVTLTKGVFHIKLAFDCSAAGVPLTQVLAQTPAGESVAIRITDVRVLPEITKVYSFQAVVSRDASLVDVFASSSYGKRHQFSVN